jgi:hypothetical protein
MSSYSSIVSEKRLQADCGATNNPTRRTAIKAALVAGKAHCPVERRYYSFFLAGGKCVSAISTGPGESLELASGLAKNPGDRRIGPKIYLYLTLINISNLLFLNNNNFKLAFDLPTGERLTNSFRLWYT